MTIVGVAERAAPPHGASPGGTRAHAHVYEPSGAADPERVSPVYSMTTCVDGRRREKWQEQSRTQRNLSGDRPAGENGVQLHVFKGVAGWGPLCGLHGAGPRESCLETALAMGGAWPHTVFRKQPTAHMGARQGSPQAEAGEGLGVSPPPMHNDTLLPPAALHLALRAALQTQPLNH